MEKERKGKEIKKVKDMERKLKGKGNLKGREKEMRQQIEKKLKIKKNKKEYEHL